MLTDLLSTVLDMRGIQFYMVHHQTGNFRRGSFSILFWLLSKRKLLNQKQNKINPVKWGLLHSYVHINSMDVWVLTGDAIFPFVIYHSLSA